MTARTCPTCHTPVAGDAAFCAECGEPVVREPAMATQQAFAEPPTREVPVSGPEPFAPPPYANGNGNGTTEAPATAQWSYGPPPPPMPPAPPGYQQAPYPVPQPAPAGGRNTGLIIGLVVASVVALAGVAAALLLALGGGDDDPVAARNAAATTPAQTVVTQIIRPRSTSPSRTRDRNRSSNSSGSRTPIAPVAANETPERSNVASTVTDAQRRSAAESAVERHWSLIESGQYSAAFNLLASSATTASESTWVQEHVEDDLTSADISVSASLTSSTTARVDVLRLRTMAESGCFTWSGSYDVAKLGGTWKITKANLTRSSC